MRTGWRLLLAAVAAWGMAWTAAAGGAAHLGGVLAAGTVLPVIGIPSALWANSRRMHTRRRDRHISYYSLYTERWANYLGEKYLGHDSIGQAFID